MIRRRKGGREEGEEAGKEEGRRTGRGGRGGRGPVAILMEGGESFPGTQQPPLENALGGRGDGVTARAQEECTEKCIFREEKVGEHLNVHQ